MSKKPNRKYVIVRLWHYLWRYPGMVILAVLLTLLQNVFALIGPYLSGKAIDAIEPGVGNVLFEIVFRLTTWMIVLYLVSSFFAYILSIVMIKLSQKVVYQLRKDAIDNLLDLPVSYFDQNQTGDIISRISYDIDTINSSLSTDLLQVCTSVITVLGSLAMMVMISLELNLVFVLTVPISIIFTRYRTNKVRPMFSKRSRSLGELNGYVEETLSGQKTVKAYRQEKTMVKRFDVKNHEAVTAYYNADYYGSVTGPSINFINNLSLALISILGSILYLYSRISLGDFSSFVLYSRKFSGPISEMANILSEIQSALAAAERVFRLIDEEPEKENVDGAYEFNGIKGNVEFNNVSFGYVENQLVLKDISFKANPGEKIAIVGPTGSGKTTLINLLMRFYDPNEGSILIDNHNTSLATRDSLRLLFAMVLQDTWLFTGTVYENLAYGKKDATMEEVVNAAKAAEIHSFIKSLPNGYDTVLDEDGMNISKGQKQMLTIARAMLLDAKILILDEATSNVDSQTEKKIQVAMQNLMRGKTSFVIAHRLSTIENADKILVIKDGKLIEQGKHQELLDKQGFYHQLYNSQYR